MIKSRKNDNDFLIDVINEKIDVSNLNYDSIRSKIKMEVIKPKKTIMNFKFKLALTTCTVILFISFILGINIINNINKYDMFYTDNDMVQSIMNYNDSYENISNQRGYNISLFTLLMNKKEDDTNLIEFTLEDSGIYYAAYLDEKEINKLNKYFESVDVEEYKSYVIRITYIGYDDLFTKYSYYINKEKVSSNIKWIKTNDLEDIKTNIGKYNLVLTLYNQKLFNDSNCIDLFTELDIHNKDHNIIHGGKYLVNIRNNNMISNMYFLYNSATIKTINEVKYLEGIIPSWYNKYIENSSLIKTDDQVIKLSNILDEIEKYKTFEEKVYNEILLKDMYLYYYNYQNIKFYLGI